jgi:uncharacterized protein YjdB
MRALILTVNGVIRHRLAARSLIAGIIAVVLSCSGLVTGPEIESVTVALTTSRPTVGETLSAVATLRDHTGLSISGQPITWSLSNPAVASITSSGNNAQITTLAAGETVVTATSSGHSGGAALTVDPVASVPVASTSVELAANSLNPGQTTQATATTRDASNTVLTGRVVSWSSSNQGVATVSESGLVAAIATGTAQITATSEGRSGSAALTVASASPSTPAPVASVAVALSSASIAVGQTTNATATLRDASGNTLTGRSITWSSSNTGVATVNSSGVATAVGAGSANIVATSEGQSGSAALTVTAPPPAPVASVTVSPASPRVQVGLTVQLSAVTRDANGNILTGRAITWSSGSPAVATVSGSGLVTTLVVGNANITATSGGVSGTAALTVTAVPPAGVSPEPGTGDVILHRDDFNRGPALLDILEPYTENVQGKAATDGHTGDGLRFMYRADYYGPKIEFDFPETTDIYFSYRYRLSPGADPTCGGEGESGFKWFMAWRRDALPRYTMGVGELRGGPAGFENTGLEFTTHDNSSDRQPNPFNQNIDKSRTFRTTADGAWHTYTLHIVTGTGGYEQIWIDGVLVLDNRSYNYDHDAGGIRLVQFPGTMVEWHAGCDFNVDVDDLVVWRK